MFRFITAEKANHSIRLMCRVLKVSKSGYFAWLNHTPSKRALRDMELTETIKSVHEASLGTYGAPRIHGELREEHDVRIGRRRVARLMRQAGLAGIHRRRTTHNVPRDEGARVAVFEDLLQRDFTAAAPNRVWIADITHHPTKEGWLYLAGVLDVFAKRIVGWSMAAHMQAELVVAAVSMAVTNGRPEPGLVHSADHGSQLRFNRWSQHFASGGVAWAGQQVG